MKISYFFFHLIKIYFWNHLVYCKNLIKQYLFYLSPILGTLYFLPIFPSPLASYLCKVYIYFCELMEYLLLNLYSCSFCLVLSPNWCYECNIYFTYTPYSEHTVSPPLPIPSYFILIQSIFSYCELKEYLWLTLYSCFLTLFCIVVTKLMIWM